MSKITDARGNTVNLAYEAVGRLSGQVLKDGADAQTYSLTLGYDSNGNLNSRTY